MADDLIAAAEDLLARVRAGEITGLVISYRTETGSSATVQAGSFSGFALQVVPILTEDDA